ncbi:hypothetical protein SAMN05216386_2611 [Nitrosospira briensis]|uniref:Uncharacterized protein n=1 Tax=Nitrosospira briensis TaxID=35799 RepID=A0A1I5EEC7_9PROT|nr:hypothetical protein SAMN05216386_2611 [Nitrosospira briensis]
MLKVKTFLGGRRSRQHIYLLSYATSYISWVTYSDATYCRALSDD